MLQKDGGTRQFAYLWTQPSEHVCPAGRGPELEASQSELCDFSRFLVPWEVRNPSEEGQG